jgi:salicylate 5-hydroxylase small subunit
MVTFDDWFAITQLYARYASVVDAADWDRWPDFFTDDCDYRIQPRKNHELGLPLATLAFTSRGMLLDRVFSIKETLFHDPYYQRHVISAPVIAHVGPGRWECEANYAVFRTKLSDTTTVFNVGRSFDTIVRIDSLDSDSEPSANTAGRRSGTEGELRFARARASMTAR